MQNLAFLFSTTKECVYIWREMVIQGDDGKQLKSTTDL